MLYDLLELKVTITGWSKDGPDLEIEGNVYADLPGLEDGASALDSRESGGTPPFGHPRGLRVLADQDLLQYDVVWAAAGSPDAVFPITPADLLRLSAAEPADFAER